MLNALLRDGPEPSREVAGVWAETLPNGVTAQGILRYALWRRTWLSRLDEDDMYVSSERVWDFIYVLILDPYVCQFLP